MIVYCILCLSAKATASSIVSNRNCTSFNVSAALDQPINGSGSRRLAGSYSRSHFLLCRRPDCIAVLDGWWMRASAIEPVFLDVAVGGALQRSPPWAGREDSNLRHAAPDAAALPGC